MLDSHDGAPVIAPAVRLSLGPIALPWGRERTLEFYEAAAGWPVDIVCIGEPVCLKRSALSAHEWLDVARRLEASGREVVVCSSPGLETPGELHFVETLSAGGRHAVEVNDLGLLARLRGRAPLVAGPHLRVYNAPTLRTLIRWGAFRWVAPYEIDKHTLEELAGMLPSCLEAEVFVFGASPLAYSPRCFTAARQGWDRKDCGQACASSPVGVNVDSLEGEPLFVQDGKQTLAWRTTSLLAELPAIVAAGASVLRIQPQATDTESVLRGVRGVLEGRLAPGDAQYALETSLGRVTANGYWHGGAGQEHVVAPLWSRWRPAE